MKLLYLSGLDFIIVIKILTIIDLTLFINIYFFFCLSRLNFAPNSNYMLLLIVLIPVLFTFPAFFAARIFEKAGQPWWVTVIPFYNLYIWLRIIQKPLWWYIFLIIPFINVFMLMLMIVELVKGFKKYALWEQGFAVIFPFIYLPVLGYSVKEKYIFPDKRPKIKKTWIREWVDAIIFAVVAATIIRTFLIEAYTIPTSSMEKSLLRGDFLFVSKISYGPKFPNTPLSFPFVHHTMPLSKTRKSFVEWIKLPYFRFQGLSKIRNNDVVVFNYPEGDTVSTVYQSNQSYYSLCKEYGRDEVRNNKAQFGDLVYRPVDKRENYIKRCIGIPGDTIKIINRTVYVNGKLAQLPPEGQYLYRVYANAGINQKTQDKLNISGEDYKMLVNGGILPLSDKSKDELAKLPVIEQVEPLVEQPGIWDSRLFPFDSLYPWNVDNYGPIYIPEKGATVTLSLKNIQLYSRLITVYENNDLRIEGNDIYINGKKTGSYTFKMDYYWMMGDNRHNSADSRFWGFVPEDHIVGKAVFVWLSLDPDKSSIPEKIRWSKLFRVIR